MKPSRHLLIVSHHFPPSAASGGFRTLGFVNHLPQFGWEPTIVTAEGMPLEPLDHSLYEHVRPEASVTYVKYPASKPSRWIRSFLARTSVADPHCVWLPRAYAACVKLIKHSRQDAVLTTGPPHSAHFLGLLIKECFDLKWIADFRDPWVTSNYASTRLTDKTIRINFWLERLIFQRADLIVANAPRAAQALTDKYPFLNAKTEVITNGYDPESFSSATSAHNGNQSSSKAPVLLVHAGEVYGGRDPGPLFQALATLKKQGMFDERPIRLDFYGRRDESINDSGAEKRRYNLGGMINWYRHMPYDRILDILCRSDSLLLLDTPGRRIGVPAKLYEYFGARKPIFALAEPDGDVAWALRESGLPHWIVAPTSQEAIQKALVQFFRRAISQPHIEIAGENGGPSMFTRRNMAWRLAEALGDKVGLRH